MVLKNKYRPFDNDLLCRYPDLRECLKPNDLYPELENINKNISVNLPAGLFNTKIIINQGEIVERVFKTSEGRDFSLFYESSNVIINQVA